MKKFLLKGCFFILPILFCATVFAATPAALNVDFSKYENAKYNFRIYYPSTWKVFEGFAGTAVAFCACSPPDGSTNQFNESSNVVIENLPAYPSLTLDKYVESSLVYLAKIITDYKLISIEPRIIADKPAKIHVFTGRQGVFLLKYTQAVILYNNKAYVVTFAVEKSKHKNYEEIATKIINSMLIR